VIKQPNQNYLEVGGDDVAALKAFGNIAANLPGVLLPPLGVLVQRLSPGGSLQVFWFIIAGFHVTCAVTIAKWLSLKTAKELLAERRRGAAAR
jgi:hypothetical protein